MSSLNERLGLFEPNPASPRILELDLEPVEYAPLFVTLQPKINIARGAAVFVLVLLAIFKGIGVCFLLAPLYLFCEWWIRCSMRTEFILGELIKVSPNSRERDGNALLCYDVSKIIIHDEVKNSVKVIPAKMIEAAKVRNANVGAKTARMALYIKLYGQDEWSEVASGISGDMEGNIRRMNPALIKRKWWQF
ncbi:hypothetical protein YA0089_13940 [Pseudomonas viridiflava]|uniref:hypothetical protein n=1 Tax=Pseudomonas viridiflava TaxID=33069 RepID=UPI0018E5AF46|nr:hypothetical protein [Pseudomonas viridiflava]MBI6724720.1 hypothetical protein [Pseudomonas viridiflava]